MTISADDGWREGLRAPDRMWVTALTAPFLRIYGYPIRASGPGRLRTGRLVTTTTTPKGRRPETEQRSRGDLSTLAKGGALSLAGSIVYGVLSFVLVIIVTRGLGRDASGAFFEAVALFIIASNAAELGADTGLVRMIARYRAIDRAHDTRWTLVVALGPVVLAGTILAAIGLVLAEPLSALFDKGQGGDAVTPYIRLLAIFLPLSAVSTVVDRGDAGIRHDGAHGRARQDRQADRLVRHVGAW